MTKMIRSGAGRYSARNPDRTPPTPRPARLPALATTAARERSFRGSNSAIQAVRAAAPSPAVPLAPVPVAEAPVLPAPTPTAAPAPASPRALAAVSSAAPGSLDLAEVWTKVVELVGQTSRFAKSYLVEAHPVSLVKNTLTIGIDPQFADHLGLVDNPKNRALIQAKLQELGYAEVQVKFINANAPADWVRPIAPSAAPATEAAPATPAPGPVSEGKKKQPLAKDDFKNDPLIKQALEIFKGQIIEVRS